MCLDVTIRKVEVNSNAMASKGEEGHLRSAKLCAVLLFSCAVSLALVAWDGNSEGRVEAAYEPRRRRQGNRPSSTSGNPGQSAGNNHFFGAVDDVVLRDRPLSGDEVALLRASDRAVEDRGDGAVSSLTLADPSNHGPTRVPLLWSDPSTWPSGSVPGEGDSVVIPDGVIIALDVAVVPSSGSLGDLTVEGTLVNHGNNDISLSASSIAITETGTLQIGSSDQPYQGQANITLTGKYNCRSSFSSSLFSFA